MGAGRPDSKTHVSHDERRRLPVNEQSVDGRRRRARAHRVRGRRRRGHGAQGEDAGDRRRSHRLHGDERGRAARHSSPSRSPTPKRKGVLFSLHLKATMMKVSDPIIFGHAVEVFFADLFAKHGDVLAAVGANPHNGLGPGDRRHRRPARRERAAIEADIAAGLRRRARPGDGRLRPGHHQPARAERRDRRRVDAGDDPHVGPDVEQRRASSRTPRPSSPTAATPASTRSSSRTATPTARSIRRPWAPCPTSG